MKVQIKTIPGRETASKIHEWTDQNTHKPLGKSKVGNAKDEYCLFPSKRLGGNLNTGKMLDIIENPEFGKSKEELGKDWEYLSDKKEITRQEYLEFKHGKPRNFYTNKKGVTGQPADAKTYMQKLKLPLSDGTTILDTANQDDEIRYYAFFDHTLIATSLDQYRKHLKPKATHYISSQDEDIEIRLRGAKLKNKAIAKLESDDFIDDNKLLVLKALAWNNKQLTLRGKDMYDIINEKLHSVYGESVDSIESPVNKFLKMYDLLGDPAGRTELSARAMLQDLLDTRIISNVKETYTWVSKGLILGHRKEGEGSVLEFLLNPDKALEYEQLENELKARIV